MIAVREVEAADAAACAQIVYEAFGAVHDRFHFPRDFPTLEAAMRRVEFCIAHPRIWGVVAEADGRVVGSCFLDQRDQIAGVGPISVALDARRQGVGRQLMEAVIARAADARGIRLLQDTFNLQSLSLYASLGFEVKEPVVVLSGRPRSDPPAGTEVRPLAEADLEECERLCVRVHGFERTNELRDAVENAALSPLIALREGRISAYATTLTFFPAAHAVAESEDDMRALIAGAVTLTDEPWSFLLPTRQSGLFRWCLDEGLQAVKPMTLMAIGEYREPSGCWIPSILY